MTTTRHRVTYEILDPQTFRATAKAYDVPVLLGNVAANRSTGWRDIPAILAVARFGSADDAWMIRVLSVDGSCYDCAGTGHRNDTFAACDIPAGCVVCYTDGQPYTARTDAHRVCTFHACYGCGGTGK